MTFVRPARLRAGDTVAVLSPSWGGPAAFPHIFDAGLAVLRDTFGLRIREYPTTRAAPADLARDPAARADDLCAAFADPEVRAIVASIGGEDSVRLLPHLDPEVLRENPKILMGYSDTTTLLAYLAQLGLVSFHGPAVMAGFAQLPSLPPAFAAHVRAVLFDGPDELAYEPYDRWSEGYPEWADPANTGKVNPSTPRPPSGGFRFLQGRGKARGELFGGSIEVLEFLKGTRFWPAPSFWEGKVLFFETSEEVPPPALVRRMLRNYAMQGAFDRAAALLFGRARGYSDAQKVELEREIVGVVAGELGRTDLPIVADMDFGHTDPQLILPLGVPIEVDCDARTARLCTPAVL